MSRRALAVTAVLFCSAVVAYSLIPRAGRSGGPRDATYPLANRIELPDPPASALQDAVLGDPVERMAARLDFGPPEVVSYTLRHLPEDPGERRRLARRLEQMASSYAAGAPLGARRFLQALGYLGDPGSVPVLLEYAQADPDYLQVVAIRALGHCPSDPAIEDVLARLSSSPNPLVAGEAQNAVLSRTETWTAAALLDVLSYVDGMAANRTLEEVGLRGLHEAADAVARHLQSDTATTRLVAMRTLLRLGDPRGLAAASAALETDQAEGIYATLLVFRDAGVPPPSAAAQALAGHDSAQVRQGLAEALVPPATGASAADLASVAVLERLADDADAAVRRTAVAQLFRHGRHVGLERYREDLRRSHGTKLREAVQFLCENLADPQAAALIRARLEVPQEPLDEVNLLFGLRFVGEPADARYYLQRIEQAGTDQDRRGDGRLFLSQYASLYVQELGVAVLPPVTERLSRAASTDARRLLLDVIRGLGAGAGDAAWQAVLARIADPEEDLRVRLAAVDTLPFFDAPSRRADVEALRRQVQRHDVARRLALVYLYFF